MINEDCFICLKCPCRCDEIEREFAVAFVLANGDSNRCLELAIGLRQYQKFYKVEHFGGAR